ncbi:MAG: cupin domain-containing protein [Candidatus Hodarchaeales archaeon]|jgi:quercetin dioxygenase-like cupin family protein
MKQKNVKSIQPEDVTMYGSTGTIIQWLWGKKDCVPRFALRKFTISPKGMIGLHNHAEENEIFILEGKGIVFNESGDKIQVEPQDTLFIPSDEPHGYRNLGDKDLVFLCIIPILETE